MGHKNVYVIFHGRNLFISDVIRYNYIIIKVISPCLEKNVTAKDLNMERKKKKS